jgi:hypothetical protein
MEKIFMMNKKQTLEINQPSSLNNDEIYEIKIKGLLDDHWQQWFERMTLGRQKMLKQDRLHSHHWSDCRSTGAAWFVSKN